MDKLQVDVKSYDDFLTALKEAAREKISGWNLENKGDPSVALLELFAWLAEGLGARLERLPERIYGEFLGFLGELPREASPAHTLVTFARRNINWTGEKEPELEPGTPIESAQTAHQGAASFYTLSKLTALVAPQSCELYSIEPVKVTRWADDAGTLDQNSGFKGVTQGRVAHKLESSEVIRRTVLVLQRPDLVGGHFLWKDGSRFFAPFWLRVNAPGRTYEDAVAEGHKQIESWLVAVQKKGDRSLAWLRLTYVAAGGGERYPRFLVALDGPSQPAPDDEFELIAPPVSWLRSGSNTVSVPCFLGTFMKPGEPTENQTLVVDIDYRPRALWSQVENRIEVRSRDFATFHNEPIVEGESVQLGLRLVFQTPQPVKRTAASTQITIGYGWRDQAKETRELKLSEIRDSMSDDDIGPDGAAVRPALQFVLSPPPQSSPGFEPTLDLEIKGQKEGEKLVGVELLYMTPEGVEATALKVLVLGVGQKVYKKEYDRPSSQLYSLRIPSSQDPCYAWVPIKDTQFVDTQSLIPSPPHQLLRLEFQDPVPSKLVFWLQSSAGADLLRALGRLEWALDDKHFRGHGEGLEIKRLTRGSEWLRLQLQLPKEPDGKVIWLRWEGQFELQQVLFNTVVAFGGQRLEEERDLLEQAWPVQVRHGPPLSAEALDELLIPETTPYQLLRLEFQDPVPSKLVFWLQSSAGADFLQALKRLEWASDDKHFRGHGGELEIKKRLMRGSEWLRLQLQLPKELDGKVIWLRWEGQFKLQQAFGGPAPLLGTGLLEQAWPVQVRHGPPLSAGALCELIPEPKANTDEVAPPAWVNRVDGKAKREVEVAEGLLKVKAGEAGRYKVHYYRPEVKPPVGGLYHLRHLEGDQARLLVATNFTDIFPGKEPESREEMMGRVAKVLRPVAVTNNDFEVMAQDHFHERYRGLGLELRSVKVEATFHGVKVTVAVRKEKGLAADQSATSAFKASFAKFLEDRVPLGVRFEVEGGQT